MLEGEVVACIREKASERSSLPKENRKVSSKQKKETREHRKSGEKVK